MGDYLVSIYTPSVGIDDRFPSLSRKQTFQREMSSFPIWDEMDFHVFNFHNSSFTAVHHSDKLESAFEYRYYIFGTS